LNVLITGGTGYVGSLLIAALIAQKHRVTVLDLCLIGDAGRRRRQW